MAVVQQNKVDTSAALQSFKKGILETTEKVVKEYLPIKIVQLTQLYENEGSSQTEIERLKFSEKSYSAMDTENQSVCANTPDENHNKKSAKTKRGKNREKKRSFAEISSDGPGESNSTTEIQLTENALCTKSAEIEEFVVLMKKEVKEFSEYLDQIAIVCSLSIFGNLCIVNS